MGVSKDARGPRGVERLQDTIEIAEDPSTTPAIRCKLVSPEKTQPARVILRRPGLH